MSHEEHVRNIPMSDAERERLIVSIQTGRAVRWIGGTLIVAMVTLGTSSIRLLFSGYMEQRETTKELRRLMEQFKQNEERTNIMWIRGEWDKKHP